MAEKKTRWLGQVVPFALLLIDPLATGLNYISNLDWFATKLGHPNWLARVLTFLESPPAWLQSLVVLAAVLLFLWGERRRNDGLEAKVSRTASGFHELEPVVLAIRERLDALDEAGIHDVPQQVRGLHGSIEGLGQLIREVRDAALTDQRLHDEIVSATGGIRHEAEAAAMNIIQQDQMQLHSRVRAIQVELQEIQMRLGNTGTQ